MKMDNRWRVVAVYKDACKVWYFGQEKITKVTGSFRNSALCRSDYPAVGDWVYLNNDGLIDRIEARSNQLSRKVAGKRHDEQIIAMNIDIMFIVSSLNKEFNINKIGRYIILAETNHITPVILLTKLDLCDDPDNYIKKINFYYPNVETVTVSAIADIGVDAVYNKMVPGVSAVFVGASGVGKSTLINRLLGCELMKTSHIRERDDKGRHTTTHRELFELENGSYVIDTPGIREIGFWINDINLSEFEDIILIGRACKYRNCQHTNEVDCAVKLAVRNGDLAKERYDRYIKASREVLYSKLLQDERERLKFKSKVKQMSKNERFNKKN